MSDPLALEAQRELILDRLLHPHRSSRLKRWLRTLAICSALLAVAGALSALKPPLPSLSLWDLRDAQRTNAWLQNAAGHCLVQAAVFLLLGLVVALLAVRLSERPPRPHGRTPHVPRGATGWLRGWLGRSSPANAVPSRSLMLRAARLLAGLVWHTLAVSGSLALVLTSAGIVVWALADAVGWSLAFDVAVALIALCLGLWLAWWAARGWCGWGALLLHACIAAGLGLLACGWLAARVLADAPYPFPQVVVTSADRRQLFDILTETSEVQEQGRIYHVTQEQLNQLLAWWFSFQAIEGKAKVALEDHHQQGWCSLRLPGLLGLSRRHLNVTAIGQCEIVSERLELDVPALEIGTLRLPPAVTQWISRQAAHWINGDPRNRAMLVGVTAAHARSDGVEVFLAHDSNRRRRLAQLFAQLNDAPDVTAAVRQHLDQFNQIAADARRGDPIFERIVKNAFITARDRSRFGDPKLENHAAILALGIALGHTHMAVFVGEVDDSAVYGPVARLPDFSRLRGRGDWARHFWISAAMTLVASNGVSDAVGLLKEELDAGTGGSGFSFADLAADRAGTEFALQATASRESARRIQSWVLGEITDLDELMPAADDLPEGLSDAELLDQFGGVGGEQYGKMQAEIEQRIRQLPWWTPEE